jgi:cytosine/adenosine deaminase-related metal-dependent hydrolase
LLSQRTDDQILAATLSSGIRSVFCYCPTPRLTSWAPFTINPNSLGDHVLPKFDELAAQSPWGNGRVTLGFAFDGFRFLPKDVLGSLMTKLEENRVQLITYHYSRVPDQGLASQTVELAEKGILDERWLVSHGGNPDQKDADIYKKFGMHVSSTPSTELQMAMGSPVAAFRDDLGQTFVQSCGLGIDCHSNNSAFMPGEARIGLQSARATRGEVRPLTKRKRNASRLTISNRNSLLRTKHQNQHTTLSPRLTILQRSAAPVLPRWETKSAVLRKASKQTWSFSPVPLQVWSVQHSTILWLQSFCIPTLATSSM